jgi:hypothetical protein
MVRYAQAMPFLPSPAQHITYHARLTFDVPHVSEHITPLDTHMLFPVALAMLCR